MRTSRIVAVGAAGIAAALALSACSSAGNGGTGGDNTTPDTSKTIGTVDGAGKTLTVWAMTGDYSDEVMKKINDEFEKQTGAKVDVQVQAWDGITTKLTTALGTTTPPDVVDIGNTQVAGYANTGGLMDLSAYKDELEQGGTWVESLAGPATFDGKLYAVPSFVGNRAVIYNKKMWADAGVTSAPTSYDELKSDLDKIKAKNPASDFSPFYLPGQFWYAGMSWVWDAGGDIATSDGGTWKGSFSSAESQKGLDEFKSFQNAYSSKASQTLNTDKPNEDQIMADGKTATIIGALWDAGLIVSGSNGKIAEDDLGTFALPNTAGESGAAHNFGGGEVWGIAQKSPNQDLALVWTKIAASPDIQNALAAQPWIPNTEELGAEWAKKATTLTQGFYDASGVTRATPGAAGWGTIEGNKNMEQFFSSVASGSKSVADAAKDMDATLDSTLNG
ncbi:extracellular solute-binding protein [Microbacterium elymi]|uniref:Extracellular solute-binding protein n=1 Tax=Microbacterium elymi TaxID=2909587 RepID=A0ABY5NKX1_9MICO|nr:extracellular solute-binding protein [Microbacterium elymi]UUT35817.1 extracellular solute-binding protein [Microbacterium elymi]